MANKKDKVIRLAMLGLLAALIVVLQQFSIPVGANSLCLVLVPLVVGAVLLGPAAGALLGGVFGVVVAWLAVEGRLGLLTNAMVAQTAFMTIALCVLKGIAAGWVAGLIAKALKNKPVLGTFLAAAAAPVVNTGIYLLGVFTIFKDTVLQFAQDHPDWGYQGETIFVIAIVGIVGTNFIIEFAANVLLAPAIRTIVNAVRKMK